LIFAALFISACFISLAIGTSVGTIAALIPIATGVAEQSGISGGFLAAIVVGGAFFGDNLSFISDTTIAATRTQGVSMRDKFFTNIRIVLPAALIVTIFYIICGIKVDSSVHHGGISVMKLLPYILVIVLSLKGVNVIAVLMLGILANVIIGFTGGLSPIAMLQSIGEGIAGMGDLIVVTLLAAGMLSLISSNGGLDFIVKMITKRINGRRGAEASIAGLVTLANVCTANNTIAIITVGSIAKEISAKFGVDPRRSASILDTFSCLAQSLLPYGAQVLMAAGLASVSSLDIIIFLYYPIVMGICAVISILFKKSTM
jgi:Na+/H+ antiporter NhaC